MAIKSLQLKKFPVKQLKKIVKDNKLGKITKKKKVQLISMIMNADNLKVILSSLSMPIKKKRVFSEKQKAAQKAFANRNRKSSHNSSHIEKKALPLKKLIGGNPATFTPKNLPQPKIKTNVDLEDVVDAIDTPVKVSNVKKLVKVAEEVADIIVSNPTKTFLDEIFGVEVFDFENEIIRIVNEMEDENKLNKFLSFPKKKIKSLLMNKFNSAMSIQQFIKSI